ncbi:hypothetical protein TWF751_004206 [Orbilia oligospora]|nr:hypothetical protein TWF751_004206 [Orbilia oligospora]
MIRTSPTVFKTPKFRRNVNVLSTWPSYPYLDIQNLSHYYRLSRPGIAVESREFGTRHTSSNGTIYNIIDRGTGTPSRRAPGNPRVPDTSTKSFPKPTSYLLHIACIRFGSDLDCLLSVKGRDLENLYHLAWN